MRLTEPTSPCGKGRRRWRPRWLVAGLMGLLLLSHPHGAAAQPAPPELGWRKSFLGTVTFLEQGRLELLQPDGQRLVFDIVAETEAIPSQMAIRVGSKVEVLATQRRLLQVQAIPYSEWLRRFPEAD